MREAAGTMKRKRYIDVSFSTHGFHRFISHLWRLLLLRLPVELGFRNENLPFCWTKTFFVSIDYSCATQHSQRFNGGNNENTLVSGIGIYRQGKLYRVSFLCGGEPRHCVDDTHIKLPVETENGCDSTHSF